MSGSKHAVAPFFWPADDQGCGQYRMYYPARALANVHGLSSEVGGQPTQPFNTLVAQRSHTEPVRDTIKSISERPFAERPSVVYELDDDLWNLDQDNPAYAYYTDPQKVALMEEIISLSDAVSVSTEHLAQQVRAKGLNHRVYVLPNSLPRRLFHELAFPYGKMFRQKPLVLGWSGSNTHLEDFKLCVPAVDRFLRKNRNATLVFFGASYAHLFSPQVQSRITSTGWIDGVGNMYQKVNDTQVDIMLAPLRDTLFTRSKSNLRVIEANAQGIPVVWHRVGPYADLVDGVNGFGAETVQDFEAALDALSDRNVRLDISGKARAWARANFDMNDNSRLWLECYSNILGAS